MDSVRQSILSLIDPSSNDSEYFLGRRTRRTGLRQRMSPALFIDIMNQVGGRPYSIKQLCEKHHTSLAKVYETFKHYFGAPPGRVRKRYQWASYDFTELYESHARVMVEHDQARALLFNETYAWQRHSPLDWVIKINLTNVRVIQGDVDASFPCQVSITDDSKTMALPTIGSEITIATFAHDQHSLVKAHLNPKHSRWSQINTLEPYRVELDFTVLQAARVHKLRDEVVPMTFDHDCIVPLREGTQGPVPDPETRRLHTLTMEETTFVVGLERQLTEKEFHQLSWEWSNEPMTGELTRTIREGLQKGTHFCVSIEQAIRYQSIWMATKAWAEGDLYAKVKYGHRHYLVHLDGVEPESVLLLGEVDVQAIEMIPYSTFVDLVDLDGYRFLSVEEYSQMLEKDCG